MIGKNQYGSDVTVQLAVQRTEPGVQEALVALNEALVKVAEGMVDTAVHEQVVQERVREQLKAQLEPAKLSAQRNADQRIITLAEKADQMLRIYDGRDIPAHAIARVRELLAEAKAQPQAKAG